MVRNNAATISDAINSVISQTYKNIEYIVIDGASTDGTVDVVQRYLNKIDKFITEKDHGLYDAMNKGITLATGDIIGILNSDDMYFDKNVIENIVNTFREKKTDSVFGDLHYVDKNADITQEYVMWNHGLSEVVNNLVKNGLEINSLNEYDYSPYDLILYILSA